jgi:hypothetical protein
VRDEMGACHLGCYTLSLRDAKGIGDSYLRLIAGWNINMLFKEFIMLVYIDAIKKVYK